MLCRYLGHSDSLVSTLTLTQCDSPFEKSWLRPWINSYQEISWLLHRGDEWMKVFWIECLTTPGTTCPTLFDKCVASLTSPAYQATLMMQETGPTLYWPLPLTISWCNYRDSISSSVILRPFLLVRPEPNSRPPAWQPDAQPTDPPVRGLTITICNAYLNLL